MKTMRTLVVAGWLTCSLHGLAQSADKASQGSQDKAEQPAAAGTKSGDWCMDEVDLPCIGSNLSLAKSHAPSGVTATCSPGERILLSGPCDKVAALSAGLTRSKVRAAFKSTAETEWSAQLVAVTAQGEKIIRTLSLAAGAKVSFRSVAAGVSDSVVHVNLEQVSDSGQRRLTFAWTLCGGDKGCNKGEIEQDVILASADEVVLVESDATTALSLGATLGLPDAHVRRLLLRIHAAS